MTKKDTTPHPSDLRGWGKSRYVRVFPQSAFDHAFGRSPFTNLFAEPVNGTIRAETRVNHCACPFGRYGKSRCGVPAQHSFSVGGPNVQHGLIPPFIPTFDESGVAF